ncbi:hypothetical protein KGF57_002508 [Candida theae]|uniref:Uncharacterized protein n=1 Tax=Candida theae TaxID=1198502 RepID=A0AAD5BF67_9ASCO|nr:uncharacterized protein KGF57_002508 [Candida theae]KAI5958663.1 hypothetical protein KGF57_002508 [Candida theae]
MSINYSTPHAVDVPVTDMDDPEDDIIFAEHQDNTHSTNTLFDPLADDRQNNSNSGLIGKLKSLLKRDARTDDYEMVSRFDAGIDDDDEEAMNEPAIDLKEYRLRHLEKKVRDRTILGGALLTAVAVVSFILYFTRNNNINLSSESNKPSHKLYSNSTHDFYKTTIIVSLDGFHPHYINPHDTPTLHNMFINDYGAPYMIPSFPSVTFPNHWTLVTGLYPSEHGIVGNTFFDTKLKKQFVSTDPQNGSLDPDFWQGGEPIWKTAVKQGVKAAVHMWPGSEVPGVGPDFDSDRFNGSELLTSKVERVMGWLDREIDTRPELILTYVPTVDEYGHQYGISGPELSKSLTYVDDFIELMKSELHKRNLDNIVNLVFVSDHGMAPTSNDRVLYLDDLIDLKNIDHIDGWPLIGLIPNVDVKEARKEIQANFDKLDKNLTRHYHIYTREEIPQRFQFGGSLDEHKFNYRLAPLWIIPDVGYAVTTHKQMEDNHGEYKPKGVHGYDNRHLLMRALFLGSGPFFKDKFKSNKVKPFENVNFYNLICESLELQPAINNGEPVQSVVSQVLPKDWNDNLVFPDLPFEVEHIVRNNATYDQLWRIGNKAKPVNEQPNPSPMASLVSEQSTISQVATQSLPQPSDFLTTTTTSLDVSSKSATKTEAATTTTQEGLGGLFNEIIDDIEDGVEAIGDALHSFIDDNF